MLRQQLDEALKEAMRARDARTVSTIRLIKAALKERDIAARPKGNDEGIADAEILDMMGAMIRQRQESAALYRQGGRQDLVEQEEGEIEVIRRFLPRQLDEAETEQAVRGLIAELGAGSVKDMGRVMAELRRRYAGQMDFGRAGAIAKQALG